jgi:hypothetical protein
MYLVQVEGLARPMQMRFDHFRRLAQTAGKRG